MIVCVIAILCITLLEVIALIRGVDGAVFGAALAGIGVALGYYIKVLKEELKRKRSK